MRSLHDPWELGGVTIPNRVVLAPLAGIGNWFVRLQAKRFGAGLAVSEMVSSFAVHYGNPKTCTPRSGPLHAIAVGIVEQTARKEGDAQGPEIPRRDRNGCRRCQVALIRRPPLNSERLSPTVVGSR